MAEHVKGPLLRALQAAVDKAVEEGNLPEDIHVLGHLEALGVKLPPPCACGSRRPLVKGDREWPSCPDCGAI